MQVYDCTHVLKDSYGRLVGFRLLDKNGEFNISEDELIDKIKNNKIIVNNLELTSYNTIKYNKDELKVVKYIEKLTKQSETGDRELDKLLNKATVMGMSIEKVRTACSHDYYIISNVQGTTIVYIPNDVKYLNRLAELTGTVQLIGGEGLESLENVFRSSKADIVDLRKLKTYKVTNMSSMFAYAEIKKIVFGDDWDTSKVTNMNGMFEYCKTDELDISNWEIFSVIEMQRMFHKFKANKLTVKGINTFNVRNMQGMFWNCELKETDTLNLACLSLARVESAESMFRNCKIKNINLTGWVFKFGVNTDNMFFNCTSKVIYTSDYIGTLYETRKMSEYN